MSIHYGFKEQDVVFSDLHAYDDIIFQHAEGKPGCVTTSFLELNHKILPEYFMPIIRA